MLANTHAVSLPQLDSLDVDGVRVAYSAFGEGAPVVALHGPASNSVQWSTLGERIRGHFRLFAPDLHGCGRSEPWPGRRPMRLKDEAAIVAALAERFDGVFHLIGHSYGGAVALRAALDMPERIASLTLVEPCAFHLLRQGGAAERRLFAEVSRLSDVVLQALASGDYQAGAARFVDYWNEPGSFASLSARRRAGLAARMPRVALDFWAAFTEQGTLADLRSALTMPVLVLEGDRSPTPTRWICRMLEGALPSAWLVTLPDAGHMAPLTDPDPVNLVVASFLADVVRGRPVALRASA